MNKLALLIVVSVALCGCNTVTQVSDKKYPPVSPDKVEILFEQPTRPHEVIALVNYSGGRGLMGEDSKQLIKICKESAAQVGADAVIVDNLQLSGIGRRSAIAGKAIKWK
ncbi:MAG TPA: hypothetical protein VMR33_12180 [Candidatus Baltobacteraceae bacterium]|jgi:hypothetical protein|nr:hypothetical protein [Candidatus Baltobacteraceae bacterium]